MAANSDEVGQSFYLQSKVFRSRERLLQDLEMAAQEASEEVTVSEDDVKEVDLMAEQEEQEKQQAEDTPKTGKEEDADTKSSK
jgi:hypothetical protein